MFRKNCVRTALILFTVFGCDANLDGFIEVITTGVNAISQILDLSPKAVS